MSINAIVESPFANADKVKRNENLLYVNVVARKISMSTGGSIKPMFFHTFYTQFLNDDDSYERQLGLEMSFAYHAMADVKYITIDRGISGGMIAGAEAALEKGNRIVFYTLCDDDSEIWKAVNEINNIEDYKERWNKGLELAQSLKEINQLGDLTDFRKGVQPEYKAVANAISTFFQPLSQYVLEAVA